MRLTIAYSKLKKRNLVLINNATYQRETLSELPIRQPLRSHPIIKYTWYIVTKYTMHCQQSSYDSVFYSMGGT